MQPEGVRQWKFPMTPSGIEPATFRLVAQWINRLQCSVRAYQHHSDEGLVFIFQNVFPASCRYKIFSLFSFLYCLADNCYRARFTWFVLQWLCLLVPNCVHSTAAVILNLDVCFVSLTPSKLSYKIDATLVWVSRLFTESKAVSTWS